MAEATLSSKNQIVVPREARQAMQVKAGDKILVVSRGDHALMLRKPQSYPKAIRGVGRDVYPKDYLNKERSGWE